MNQKQANLDVQPFFLFLTKFIDITETEFDQFARPYLEFRTFNKKELITRAGEVELYMNFVLEGLVRKFYLKDKEEINTQISTEGHLINSLESFYSHEPSEYSIEAIEPTTLLSMTYENLERFFSRSQKMEKLGRKVITFSMILKDRWEMNRVKLSPREHFIDFVNKNPELLQRVPQKYLASFLNIKPETFSRFKHLLRERKLDSRDS